MIKKLIISLLFCVIFTFSLNGTNLTYFDSLDINFNPPDTIFIIRELDKHSYHAVYIDTTRPKKYYDRLTDFSFDDYDQVGYFSDYTRIEKEDPNIFKSVNNTNLPENWIRVYPYKNKFYVYAPSEWGAMGRKILRW